MNMPEVYVEDETQITPSSAPKSTEVQVHSKTGVTDHKLIGVHWESPVVPRACTTQKERQKIERHSSVPHLFSGVCCGTWRIHSLAAARSLEGTHSLAAAFRATMKTY